MDEGLEVPEAVAKVDQLADAEDIVADGDIYRLGEANGGGRVEDDVALAREQLHRFRRYAQALPGDVALDGPNLLPPPLIVGLVQLPQPIEGLRTEQLL